MMDPASGGKSNSCGRLLNNFEGRPIEDAISRIRFSSNNRDLLLISSWDSILRLYDISNDMLQLEVSPPSLDGGGSLLDCCFQDDHSFHAFAASSDSTIWRYDLCSGVQNIVGKHDDAATCVEYSDTSGLLISAGMDKKLIFWDLRMMTGYPHKVASEVFSLSLCGINLLSAEGRHVNMYDMRYLKEPIRQTEVSMDYQIRCVQAFPDCQGYFVGSVDGRVALKYFDPSKDHDTGCVFRCHPRGKDGKYYMVSVNDIRFHPFHDTFVTGDGEGYAIVWDAKSKKRIFELPRYPSSVASLSFNYSGNLLAVASSYTYREAEVEKSPQIFIIEVQNVACPESSE